MRDSGAVRMLAGWEIRRHARSTVALTIMVGLVGAVVIATLAGARRSDTALDRFNAYSRTADVEFSISLSTASQRAALRRTPGVIAVARLRGYGVFLPKAPNLTMAAQVDDVIGKTVDRPRVVEGRRANLAEPNEIAISESLASQLHLRLGSVVAPDTYTVKQKEIAFSGGQPGPPAGPKVRFRVVGIVRLPYDLGDRAVSGWNRDLPARVRPEVSGEDRAVRRGLQGANDGKPATTSRPSSPK